MTKLIVLTLVLGLHLATIIPVAAGGNRLNGEIIAINGDALQITIRVISGSDYVGNEVLILVKDKTILCESVGYKICKPISFEDLKIGDRVGVTGKFVGDILYAKKIVVH